MHRLHKAIPAAALLRHVHTQQTVCDAIQEICDRLSRQLSHSGVSYTSALARTEAKVLVANALLPRLSCSNDVFFHKKRKLTEQEAAQLNVSVKQRSTGEPLAYIIGRREFWSMEFAVTNDTLIPRSDSEVLIEALVEQFHPQTPLYILDIGTGTGCLLLSALSEFPRATGVGIDISLGALEVAKKNALFHNLDGRTEFLLRDLQTLPGLQRNDKAMYQRFDVVLCNPPYIPRREIHLVGSDVLKYEPHLALFPDGGPMHEDTGADPDGLRMYELLHASVGNLFKSHTERVIGSKWQQGMLREYATEKCLLMEIGSESQARSVQTLFTLQSRGGNESWLQFERFCFDASGKCRGVYFMTR